MEKVMECVRAVLLGKGGDAAIPEDGALRLREDLGFDSFDLAELTVRLEDAFGVDVFESGAPDTIDDLRRKLNL